MPERTGRKQGSGRRANSTSFKPGDPRINRNGRPKGSGKNQLVTVLMKEYLLEEDTFEVKGTNKTEQMERIRAFVRKMFSLAMAGQGRAAKLVWNYVDGLPPFSGKLVIPRDEDEESGLDAETEEAVDRELTRLIMGSETNGGAPLWK